MSTFKDAEKVTPQQLRGMTPPQIDELFAAVDNRRGKLYADIREAQQGIHWAIGDKRRRGAGWGLLFTEAREKAEESAAKDPKGSPALALRDLAAAHAAYDDVMKGVYAKLDAEFNRRGRWNRAWLVTDGHAHSTENCSSCHKGEFRTPLHWMTDYAGKTEKEIVDAAGERACTICYPSAPVSKGLKAPKSAMLTAEEIERARLREEEKARRAEKAAKAALNAITQPDGTPLRDEMGRDGKQEGSIVKTLRTARSELKGECWYQYAWGDEDGRHERNIQHLARAVAWKENGHQVGTEPTPEEIAAVIKPLREKAVKEVDKARREEAKRS